MPAGFTINAMMRGVLILAASLLTITAHAAQVYKWTDAEGRVHYSGTPPPTGGYETVTAPDVPAEGPSSYQRAREMSERIEAREAAAQEQRRALEQAAREAEARARNCRTARENEQTLVTYRRILVPPPDGQGEPVRMTEPQRQQKLADARAAIEKYCN